MRRRRRRQQRRRQQRQQRRQQQQLQWRPPPQEACTQHHTPPRLGPSQLVNHFPGSYGIGRKDYLWKNLARMQRQFGPAYDFVAKSYLLPRDREYFERDYCEGDVRAAPRAAPRRAPPPPPAPPRTPVAAASAFCAAAVPSLRPRLSPRAPQVFIVKPPASAEGRGIRLMTKLEQAPKGNTAALVQKYLGEPYLINNKKFDMRIYIGVTSFDPLRAYIFEEGLSRFATSDYTPVSSSNRKNRYMHLTNYSVNKKSSDFVRNTDAERDDEGSKWSLTATWKFAACPPPAPRSPAAAPATTTPSPPLPPRLRAPHHRRYRYLAEHGVDVPSLQARIKDICIKTLISVEHSVVSKCYERCHGKASCFEVFGFDVLLDKSP